MLKTFIQKKFNYLIIFTAIFCLYLPAITYGFAWDDFRLITNNSSIANLSNFFSDLSMYPHTANRILILRPLLLFSFVLNYKLSHSAALFHAINIILHIINISLLFRIISHFKILSSTKNLLFCLIYAVLPIHASAVTYISGRSDLLSATFILIAINLFLSFYKKQSFSHLVLAACCTMLASFTKETAIIVVGFTLVYVLLYETKQRKLKAIFNYSLLPFGLSLIPYTVWWAIYTIQPVTLGEQLDKSAALFSFPQRILIFINSIPNYLNLLFNPIKGMYVEIIPFVNFSINIFTILSLSFFSIFISSIYTNIRNKNYSSVFFLMWFIIGLIPYSNLIVPTMLFPKPHFLYIPAAGLLLGLFIFLDKTTAGIQTKAKHILPTTIMLLIIVLSCRTFYINTKWKNAETLYTYNLKQNPEKIHYNLGLLYFEQDNLKLANNHLKKSISASLDALKQNYTSLISIYSVDENKQVDIREKINKLNMNIIPDNIHTGVLDDKNIILPQNKDIIRKKILKNNNTILRQMKNSLLAQAAISIKEKQYESAELSLQKAIQLKIKHNADYGIYYNLGIIYERTNRIKEAKQQYLNCLSNNASYTPAQEALARIKG